MRTQRELDLAKVGSAIGHPARAAILEALLGGQWLTAGELARRAGVAPSTASEHLASLVEAALIRRRRSGRHRYFALAGREVAGVLESLARLPAASGDDPRPETREPDPLRWARTCYDHLAGTLGVRLTEAMVAEGLIEGSCREVTPKGERWFERLGIDIAELRGRRRTLVRPCLDWSERRDHLAGAVGAGFAACVIERGWLVRLPGTRALRLTLRGSQGLYRALGLEISPPPRLHTGTRGEGRCPTNHR
jgi:DNA-binding transcriptional ArsR family regulator